MCSCMYTRVGNGISFWRNSAGYCRLGTFSFISQKKVLIPEVFRGPRKSRYRSLEQNGAERKYVKKSVLQTANRTKQNFLSVPQKSSFLTLFLKFYAAAFWENDSKQKFPVPANRFESVFSSAECFGTKFRKFASILKWGSFGFLLFTYVIQHCFICRPSDSTLFFFFAQDPPIPFTPIPLLPGIE